MTLRCRTKANTKKQVISSYETGKRVPKISDAQRYATVLGVQLEEMLDVLPPPDERLEALHQNPKLCLLFDRARNMSDKDIDLILQITDHIVKENYGD